MEVYSSLHQANSGLLNSNQRLLILLPFVYIVGLNKLILTDDVFLFGSRRGSNFPALTLVSLYSLVGRLGMYSA